ncbi:MAG: TonB-dependent receptor [Caulobacteraceae bacterium]|nr:TonB-dependent receptor [Caulobacteraceae bacterium]
MISGFALVATGAAAQTVPSGAVPPAEAAATSTAPTPGELVVTGSRIPQPNLTSIAPVTAVTSAELKLEGTTNVETLLNNLPQVSPDFGLFSDNGTQGAANVDLRGLGSVRTLVLIDGKRLQPGDPLNPVPDLDTIPAALVDRVDVLTGGASAVYGSDAVAGVVNFIMRKNFEGIRVDAQYGVYQANNSDPGIDAVLAKGIFGNGVPITGAPHGSIWDGQSWDFTVALGVNAPDGKGNVTAYAEYRHVDPVTQAQRLYSYCSLGTVGDANGNYTNRECIGSSNSAFGRFRPSIGGNYADNPNGTNTFIKFNSGLDFNFAPYQYLLSQNQRYSAGYFAHYDLSDHFQVYSDLMFSDNDTQGQLGPSGLFQRSLYNINCNNPLMSPSQQAAICGAANAGTPAIATTQIGYRFASVGGAALPRHYDYDHEAFKVDLGLKGDLGGGWSYDIYGQFGRSRFSELVEGQLSITAIQNALEVNPNGTCFVGAPCVPLNIFQVGGVTQAMAHYLAAPGIETGFTDEQVVEGNIVGDLGHYGLKSPWSTDGVGVAFGADYRRESLGLTVDALTASGNISGSGGATPPANGAFDVKEVYGELRVPIVQDMPFMKLLQLEAGYRFSHYSSAGDTNAYKISGEWAITEDIRLRGGYNRAVRAPNVVELFTPQHANLFSGSDPCAKVIPVGSANYAGCLASGASAAQLAAGSIPDCPAGQCNEIVGGNPLLKPETADTYTVGAVVTPHWVRGLSFSVDYFNIKVTNLIEVGLGGASVELSQCVATASPLYCSLIKRDPTFGSIAFSGFGVQVINENIGALATKGYDVAFDYRFRPDDYGMGHIGSFDINLVGTYTESLKTTPIAGQGSYDCIGFFGVTCGTPTPYWRHKLRLTWTAPAWPVTVSAQWRYIGGSRLDLNSTNAFLQVDGQINDTPEAKINAYSYFDLSGTWRIKDRYTLRAGVNNLFDREPPLMDTSNLGVSKLPFGNANTYPNVYDPLGRQFFVGITADF